MSGKALRTSLSVPFLRGLLLVLACTMASHAAFASDDAGRSLHEEALRLARAGQTDQGASMLKNLVARYPGNRGYLHDYLTVLSWSGRDANVVRQAISLDDTTAPDYTLAAIAKSARNIREYATAARYYELLLKRKPDNLDAWQGLIYTLTDGARYAEAGRLTRDAAANKRFGPQAVAKATRYVNDEQARHYRTLAREGKTDAALARLRELLEQDPDNLKLRHDYIVTLQWAGHNEQALAQAAHIQLDQSPIFVLESLGKAARDTRQFESAISSYRHALEQDGERLPSTLGLALALADAGRAEEGVQILKPRADREPKHIPIWEALAYVYLRKRDWFAALAAYEHILTLDSTHRAARVGRIMVTSHMGAPHLALSMAQAAGDILNDAEMDRLLTDRAAVTVRWGELGSPLHEERHNDIDLAIDYLHHNLDRFQHESQKKRGHIVNAQFDMLVALRDRKHMREAIKLYEQLLEQEVEFTNYALIAAADAYLYQEQPAKARDVYLQALNRQPGNFNIRLSLFYAYLENEQFGEAYETIDALNTELKPWDKKRANRDKLAADSTATAARAYGNLLKQAQERLVPLQRRAPHNTNLRNLLAHIYMWRGWNKRAIDEFNIVLSTDPEHLSARIGRSRAYFNQREYRVTERQLQDLLDVYPENKHVLEASRLWGVHNRRELRIDVTSSTSDGLTETSDDQTIDTYLYSQPFDYNYRIFLHDYRAKANVVEGHVEYRRVGIGLEYRQPRWKLLGEATRDHWFGGDPGYKLRADWTPDDNWNASLAYDSQAIDISLRGRYYGIDAKSLSFDTGYRVSDTRDFGIGMQHYEFSDGNRRESASARWYERLYTHPRFRTNGILRLYASRNRLTDVPYFSPRRDRSIEYTLDNEWLTYRDYGFRFYQRLILTLGRYYQDGFDGENVTAIRYEHDWNVHDNLLLLYGVKRSRPVYDGIREPTTGWYLTFVWRF